MQIKRLELLGFKSFVDPTVVEFDSPLIGVVGPNGCGKCVAGDSLIPLATGDVVTIRSLVESALEQAESVEPMDDGEYTYDNPNNIHVLSLDATTLQMTTRPVLAFVRRTSPRTLLKITTRSGRTVTATKYHPFFVYQEGAVRPIRADELKLGTAVAAPRRLPVEAHRTHFMAVAETDSSEAGELVPVDNVLMTGSKHTKSLQVVTRLTPDWGRFLGYVISEGQNSVWSDQVRFVNSDPRIVEDFCRISERLFGRAPVRRAYKKGAEDCFLFSSLLCNLLDRTFGIRRGGHSSTKKIPSLIFSAPDDVVWAFLSALIEGDGCIRVNSSNPHKRMAYVEYATASETLARGLTTLLLRLGVPSMVRAKQKQASNGRSIRKTYYSVYIYGSDSLQRLAAGLSLVGKKRERLQEAVAFKTKSNPNVDLLPLALCEEFNRLWHLAEVSVVRDHPLRGRLEVYRQGGCQPSRSGLREAIHYVRGHATSWGGETEAEAKRLEKFTSSEIYWDEITGLEEVPGEEWVYDLSVAETHNFVANDLVVHNSNIVDAIRWVMGEMSAKSLRGRSMEDVIFNGSETRSPVNMAEVSLTFSTEDGIVPTEYAGFSEITIARRLFRSGESEYLINKVPARLRDIIELFLGTGVGHRAYSVVEQGRIDFAINSKPEDRRLLIEEAAGISKFKARKEAALRKMEGTTQNLARLKDIQAEVGRQISSLDRQVKKAERYHEYKKELRELELQLAGTNYLEGTHESEELEGLLADWNRRETEAQARLSTLETEMETRKLDRVQRDREVGQLQEKIFEVSSRLKLLEAAGDFRARERKRLEEEKGRSLQVIQEGKKVRAELERLETELNGCKSSTIRSRTEQLKEEIAGQRTKQESLEQDLALRREGLAFKRSRLKSLQDLERNFEGYEDGVRALLKARKEGVSPSGILGVVADVVDSPPEYEMAVSAALGEKLQFVIVKSHEEGVEAISYLKSQASGRSTFISLDICGAEARPFPYHESGVIGPLLERVRLRADYSKIGSYLLGDVILVDDLECALTLWRSNGHNKTLVTLEGEVVDPYGVVSGGSAHLPGKLLLEKKREMKELKVQVAELEEEIGLKEDSASQFEGSLSEMVLLLEELKKQGHEQDLKVLSLENECDTLRRELDRVREEEEAARLAEQKLKTLIEEGEQEVKAIASLRAGLAELSVQSESARQDYQKSTAELEVAEQAIRELRKEYDLARSHTGDLRVTLSRLEGDLRHLEQQIMEKYAVALSTLASQYQGVDVNRPMAEQHLAELKAKLERLGDVNLGAIPEYEELKTRQEFLSRQLQDLEQSLEALKKAIQKINQTTRQRFEETFALVNERFQALFPRLFRGGRAELRLTEGEDLLNAGVDLFVQPPGKRLAHVGLLSGGEKAMSAVAFIFSIFLVKPSPFCILDEVDAPLDDANVDRFHKLLSEMLPRSQFILITHNRRTMEQCHRLYGVTMEEAGISKLVTVRLAETLPLAS